VDKGLPGNRIISLGRWFESRVRHFLKYFEYRLRAVLDSERIRLSVVFVCVFVLVFSSLSL
jgi:hypothetical protein